MNKILIYLILLTPLFAKAQNIQVVKFDQLENIFSQQNDTVYLVNYWATWCKPCVEEIPAFLKLNNELQNKKFSLILVSLDFPKHITSRLVPFIRKNNINCRVVVLDDDANIWINKVDENWDGSIPVSQVIVNGKKQFYDKSFEYEELKQIIAQKFKH